MEAVKTLLTDWNHNLSHWLTSAAVDSEIKLVIKTRSSIAAERLGN